jgi:hypothetical protein
MQARQNDITMYAKELNGEIPAGTFYDALYRESRKKGAHHNAAKALASRRWNLANKAYWTAGNYGY